MALSSASTITEVVAEYLDTADYDNPTSGFSLDVCQRHVVALRYMLHHYPASASHGAASITRNRLDAELEAALSARTANAQGTNPGVLHLSVEDFS